MVAALRKSSEGPLPWAAMRHSGSGAPFPPHHSSRQQQQHYLLGPCSQPPVRRASLQHQRVEEEGGREDESQCWPLPLYKTAASVSQMVPRPRWVDGIGLDMDHHHRHSQPQLCQAGSQELAGGTHRNAAASGGHNPIDSATIIGHHQRHHHRFGLASQKVPSQPMLASSAASASPYHQCHQPFPGQTPPRPRRQLPPLISQNSFGSPLGSPRAQRKYGTYGGGGGGGTPPGSGRSGQNSPRRKASVGYGIGPSSSALDDFHRHPDVGISAGEQFSPDAIFRAGGGGGICRGGVERRILLRRCPQSDLASRFQRHHHGAESGSRGSSFSGSNESTPTRTMGQQDREEIIDPVYLALKQATAKYGSAINGAAGNGGSRTGSRRGSQCALAHAGHLFDSATPSPRNLSQTSLQDSGYSGGPGDIGGSRSRLIGSTPHLHGVGAIGGPGGIIAAGGHQGGQGGTGTGQTGQNGTGRGGGRRPKLSEKMKSLSLDCEGMPAPIVQSGLGRNPYFKSKPIRSAHGFATSGDSFEDALERSISPPPIRPSMVPQQPRRLPPAPPIAAQPQSARQQQQANGVMPSATAAAAAAISPATAAASGAAAAAAVGTGTKPLPVGTHVVIHEYVYGDCSLYLGDRLVVVDNGDPDWKHGFRVNDRLEQLYTFPSTCVAAFQPEEQPMRLIQNCNLTEKKLRLYRDQVVFVQPNSLREDGRVMIRNEHGTYAYCPLQFLMLM